jgi:hypothetical protein
MVAYATNGREDHDGQTYRAAVVPHDADGVRFDQLQPAVLKVAKVKLIVPTSWEWDDVLAHLRAKKGLVLDGWYEALPRAYRYQLKSDFAHAIWASHFSHTSGMRIWDPLNPDIHSYGRWMPGTVVRDFLEELQYRMHAGSLYVAYVPLQRLVV